MEEAGGGPEPSGFPIPGCPRRLLRLLSRAARGRQGTGSAQALVRGQRRAGRGAAGRAGEAAVIVFRRAPSSPHPFVLLCGSEQLNFPGGGVRGRCVSAPREAGVTGPSARCARAGAAAARARTDAGQGGPLSQPAYMWGNRLGGCVCFPSHLLSPAAPQGNSFSEHPRLHGLEISDKRLCFQPQPPLGMELGGGSVISDLLGDGRTGEVGR